MLRGDAQLTTGGHDVVDIAGGGGDFRGHPLGCRCQLVVLLLRGLQGLAHIGKRGLKVQTGLHDLLAKRHNGRGEHDRHAPAQRRGGLANGRPLRGEGRERGTSLRPCGLQDLSSQTSS